MTRTCRGVGASAGRLYGLAIDDGQERSVHGLPQRRVKPVVRPPLRGVADGVPRTAAHMRSMSMTQLLNSESMLQLT